MNYTVDQLKGKILEFHPEIARLGLDLNLTFDAPQNRYALKLSKAGEELGLYLQKSDADDCMAGKKCVNLAVQVAQILEEFKDILTPRKHG